MLQLSFSDGDTFSQGSCSYHVAQDGLAGNKLSVSIQIRIGPVATTAMVDTGGVWLVCDPQVASASGIGQRGQHLQKARLTIRGTTYEGRLDKAEVSLLADDDDGKGISFQPTVWVPILDHGTEWSLPSFLGWQGCLESLRFAIDPKQERFFFGLI